ICRESRRQRRSLARSSMLPGSTRAKRKTLLPICHRSVRRNRNSHFLCAVCDRRTGGFTVKRTALLAVTALLLVQQAVASPWFKDTASAQKKAKEKNQLIFVDL